jgi:molecular chaperone DnaJ
VISLRDKALPTIGHPGRGDQQIVLNVAIPRNLTSRQRELLTELRDSLTDANTREAEDESILAKVRRALR